MRMFAITVTLASKGYVMQLVETLRTRIALHRQYSKTLRELKTLPMSIKTDLEIYGNEAKLARTAVYGK